MRNDPGHYDAIIIGAGISGLVTGCYLAKAGKKVLVVEQHDKPGGYFTSFRRKGFIFDAAAHSFGNYREGGHVRKILADLGVNERITIRRFDPADIVVTPDFKLTFWNDNRRTLEDIASAFPGERSNIARFFDFVTSADQSEFVKLRDKTFMQLLTAFFEDQRLINALAMPVYGNGGLPPSLMHAFNGVKIFSEFILDGGYYPEGGIQRLPNALADVIQSNNGEMLYKKRVTRILHTSGNASGVEIEGGQRFFSRQVVSACDMVQTQKNLLEECCRDDTKRALISAMTPSLSTFILYIGIDKQCGGLPSPGSNIWYLPHYDLSEIHGHVVKCDFDGAAAFMLRVAPDGRTLLAFIGAPYMSADFWRENKKQTAQNFLRRLEVLIPSIGSHVAYMDAATPSTLHRYTLNYQGAAFGWAKTKEQAFSVLSCKNAPMKKLFFTGHWTSIGFGLPGTCYSGFETAKRILREAG